MRINNLSIFFPSFNEEKNIEIIVKYARAALKKYTIKYEILIIDDGSTDKTGDVADVIAKKYPHVRVIHQPNGGYGMALRSGFREAKYEWVVYTDSDGQFDFSEINKFFNEADSAKILWGYRIKRRDPFIRLVFAFGWKILLFLFFGLKLRDVDCGFKMLHKDALQKIYPLESTRGAMINAEVAIKAVRAKLKIIEIGVTHHPRLYGKPTGASLKVIINSFFDLLKMWTKYT